MSAPLVIIGGGAAGLAAAAHAPLGTVVLEAGPELGRKILVTGGGRCNFTHEATAEEIAAAFHVDARSVRFALEAFPPAAQREWFEELGVPSVVEDDGRVFPVSNRASDIRDALVRAAQARGVRMECNTRATRIEVADGAVCAVVTSRDERIETSRVIFAAGGAARPRLGTDGSAFAMLEELGIAIVPPTPAISPLLSARAAEGGEGDAAFSTLAGVSMSDALVRIGHGRKAPAFRGAILFTDRGLTGPAALNASADVFEALRAEPIVDVRIALHADRATPEAWLAFLEEARRTSGKTMVRNVLSREMPNSIALAYCAAAGVGEDIATNQLPRAQMLRLAELCAGAVMRIRGIEGFDVAMVSRGGVSMRAVNPHTLETRAVRGLYVVGEALSPAADCGGYNLTWAWASGKAAAQSAG